MVSRAVQGFILPRSIIQLYPNLPVLTVLSLLLFTAALFNVRIVELLTGQIPGSQWPSCLSSIGSNAVQSFYEPFFALSHS
jgi:hypothetical protein